MSFKNGVNMCGKACGKSFVWTAGVAIIGLLPVLIKAVIHRAVDGEVWLGILGDCSVMFFATTLIGSVIFNVLFNKNVEGVLLKAVLAWGLINVVMASSLA